MSKGKNVKSWVWREFEKKVRRMKKDMNVFRLIGCELCRS